MIGFYFIYLGTFLIFVITAFYILNTFGKIEAEEDKKPNIHV